MSQFDANENFTNPSSASSAPIFWRRRRRLRQRRRWGRWQRLRRRRRGLLNPKSPNCLNLTQTRIGNPFFCLKCSHLLTATARATTTAARATESHGNTGYISPPILLSFYYLFGVNIRSFLKCTRMSYFKAFSDWV